MAEEEKDPFMVIGKCKADLPKATGPEKGRIFERMGDAYVTLIKGNKALMCYHEAYDAGNMDTGFIEKFTTQLANSGKGKEAEAIIDRTLERTASAVDKARVLNQSSFISRHTGQFDKGIASARAALDMVSELEDDVPGVTGVRAQAYTMIGLNLWRKGEVEEAKANFETALGLFESIGDRAGMGATLNHLGVMVSLEGQPEKALELYKRSLENSDMARTHNNIGLSLKILGRFDDAEKAFKDTIKRARNEGNQVGIHITQINLATLSLDKGDVVKARTWVDMAHKGFKEIGEDTMMALILEVKARVLLAEGDIKGAKGLAVQALEMSQRTKEKEYEANTMMVFGLIAKAEGRLDMAKEHMLQAIKMMESNKILRYLGECYLDLVLVERELGSKKGEAKAAAEARKYLEMQGARFHLERMEKLGL